MPIWLRRVNLPVLVVACGTIGLSAEALAQAGVEQSCGGPASPSCSVGLFCEVELGQCADENAEGRCIVRTEACTKIYKPVCGCDGQTYPNDCTRIAAAARKDHDGECKK